MTRKLLLSGAVALLAITAHLLATSGTVVKPKVVTRDADAIATYANRLVVGPPHRYNDLSLFLVTVPGARIPGVDMTLDQAVERNLVEVTELNDSAVNTLTVRNRGKEPVFAMGGEMLRGGKQDRIIADDLVLPARATLDVAVYCVEHGRWALGEAGGGGGARRGSFTTGHSLAGADVRQAGGGGGRGGGQGAVWESVARQQRSLKAESPTGALRSVHDSRGVRDQISPYLHAFSDLAEDNPKACGVVAAVGREILAADLFSSPAIFRDLWPDLLESYAIDTVERTGSDHPDRRLIRKLYPDTAFVVRWLNGLRSAERVWRKTPGEGALYDLHTRDFTGSALVWEGGVVHLGLLPAVAPARPEPATRLLTPGQRRQALGR